MKLDNLFIDIHNIQSPSRKEDMMIEFLRDYSKQKGYICVLKNRNVYLIKGRATLYPCFVAHTDTCASFTEDLTLYTYKDEVFGINRKTDKQTQVGFDDKVGIYLALQMMDHMQYAKGFFPHSEEVGCIGSHDADMHFFDDCGYVIQCDRTGDSGITDDISWTEVLSKDFKDVIAGDMSTYKRKYVSGMMTDVQALKLEGLGVVCMNIECGYYNPHRNDDYLKVDQMYNTLDFVKAIVKSAGYNAYKHQYEEDWRSHYPPTRISSGILDAKYHNKPVICDCCLDYRYSNTFYYKYQANICVSCFMALEEDDRKNGHLKPDNNNNRLNTR